jgi:hypothetical protein
MSKENLLVLCHFLKMGFISVPLFAGCQQLPAG